MELNLGWVSQAKPGQSWSTLLMSVQSLAQLVAIRAMDRILGLLSMFHWAMAVHI